MWKLHVVEPYAYLLRNKKNIVVNDKETWYINTNKPETFDVILAKHEDFITPKVYIIIYISLHYVY